MVKRVMKRTDERKCNEPVSERKRDKKKKKIINHITGTGQRVPFFKQNDDDDDKMKFVLADSLI